MWLWRADHAELAPGEQPRPGEQYHLVVPGECSVENGLIVDGDDVTAYGLAVEHTDRDQVICARRARPDVLLPVHLPARLRAYDGVGVRHRRGSSRSGDNQDVRRPGLRRLPRRRPVKKHGGWAPGVYSFRDYRVIQAAIVAPDTAEVSFMNAFTKKLKGTRGSTIERYEAAARRAADARGTVRTGCVVP